MAHPFDEQQREQSLGDDLQNLSLSEEKVDEKISPEAIDSANAVQSPEPLVPPGSPSPSTQEATNLQASEAEVEDLPAQPAQPSLAPPPGVKSKVSAEQPTQSFKAAVPPPPPPLRMNRPTQPPVPPRPPVDQDDPDDQQDNKLKYACYAGLGIAVVALLLAGYAAFFNNFTTADISQGSITSSKIAAGAVGNEELAPDVIRQGEPGAQGPAGPAGGAGPAGISNLQVKTQQTQPSNSTGQEINLSCENNQQIITGGASIIGSGSAVKNVVLQKAGPSTNDGQKWTAKAISLQAPQGEWSLRLTITCATFKKQPQRQVSAEQIPAQGAVPEKQNPIQQDQQAIEKFEEEYGVGSGSN
jgi:hypothetical protein